ncbi:MAG TPA: carbon monoxide dehydrogenase subunit G [Vicinamibacterales bacterium]
MELRGQYAFDAPVDRVWERLMDPATIASCLPGCQRFEPLGDDRYQVVLTAGVAAITGTFEGTVAIADKLPVGSYRLIVEGKGRPGFANGDAAISLTPNDASTTVDVVGNVRVGGLVAQVGQRLLGATAKLMMDKFFKCLNEKVVGSR